MRTGGVGAALLGCALLAIAGGAGAQEPVAPPSATPAAAAAAAPHTRPPRLRVTLPADPGHGSPVVRATNLLDDGVLGGAMRDGFGVRFQFRLELWRASMLFDRLERDQDWLALVQFDPISGVYTLTRGDASREQFTSLDALATALAVPYTVDLPLPGGRGRSRYYYIATLDVESLSLSELEEVERWLRGDLGHALTREGGGDVGSALARGARRLLVRFSGLPSRRLEARSGVFSY